jgi:hypothetical protein
MGTLGESNGGDRPPNGDGLPGLPPEWGTVVVPDDPAALADEAAAVRRELRASLRRSRWRRRLWLHRTGRTDEPSLGLPLLIMAIAVIATLTSLFAVAWPKPQRQAADERPARVPDITLFDDRGATVRLDQVLPAVVLLVDGCECQALLGDVATAADSKLTILAVAREAPKLLAPSGATSSAPQVTRVRGLADPNESLRTALGLPKPNGRASVAVFSSAGNLVKLVPTTSTVDDFRGSLTAQ